MLDPVNVGIEESNTLYVPQTFCFIRQNIAALFGPNVAFVDA